MSEKPEMGRGFREVGGARATHRPGPRCGDARPDQRILEDVCDALTDDDRVDARGIEVSVAHGVVTLEGLVDSRPSKRAAEDLALEVRGVRDVENRLRILPEGGASRPH